MSSEGGYNHFMNLASSVADLVRSTRAQLLPYYGNAGETVDKGGGAIDMVTKLDTETEEYLASNLEKLDSSIGFAGEERGGSRDQERFWLCDPIDGTGHYIRGMPFCTVMLALIEEQQVTQSYIYDFVNDHLYTARKGEGAFRNGEPIRVSQRPLSNSYLGWETHIDKPENLERFLKLRDRSFLFKTLSAGYEFTQIASGRLEGRVHFEPHGRDWDFAPGSLLVSEAGGIVANLGKRSYDYRKTDFIAANPLVFRELTEGPTAPFPIHD